MQEDGNSMRICGRKVEEIMSVVEKIAKAFKEWEETQWKKLKEIVTEDKLKEIDVYELVLTLYWVLHQSTADENNEADSRAISSYARGLRLLAKLGLFKIEHEYGRRVIGKFVPLW